MENMGLSQRFIAESALYPDLFVGRVVSQYKDLYKAATADGELMAEVPGRFLFDARTLSDYPAVGDFVMLDRKDDAGGNAIIHHVLKRKSAFIRRAAGTSNDEQVVASNIDTAWMIDSGDYRDFPVDSTVGHTTHYRRGYSQLEEHILADSLG